MDFNWILYLLLIFLTYIQDCFGSCTTEKKENGRICKSYHHYQNCYDYRTIYVNNLICHNISDISNYRSYDIRILEIYNSQIEELKSEFFNGFSNTTSLIMKADEINNIEPGSFNTLSNLENLDLSYNNIRILQKGAFSALANVKRLNVAKNNISEVEMHAFTGTNNLEALILKDNAITNTDHLLTRCNKLELLDLSRNNITVLQLPNNCTTLKHLNISHNYIKNFTNNILALYSLETLDISFNHLDLLENNILKKFIYLKELNLSHNLIFQASDVPIDLFQDTLLLTFLNLSSTGIKNLAIGTFARLHKLEILDLSSNRLSNLPLGSFHDLIALRELYLSGNYLTYFSLNDFTKLEYIDLNDNLWNCDTFLSITKQLTSAKVKVARGYSYNTTNIYGISCTEIAMSTPNTITPTNYSDDNLNILQKEYHAFFEKIHGSVKQLLSQQVNISEQSQFELQNYWTNLTRDYQNFFHNIQKDVQQISLYQRNISNQMYLQQQNSYTNLNTDFQNIQKDVQQMLNYFKDAFISSKNSSLVLGDKNSKSQYDEQSTIKELKAALIESNAIQRNYSAMIQNSQSNFEKLILHVMAKCNSTENLSQIMDPTVYKSDFLISKVDNKSPYNGNGAIVAGLYCIVTVLIIGFALVLLVILKKIKIYTINNDECNPLNTMQI